MKDEQIAIAESSPAIVNLKGQERANWLSTGEVPDMPPPKEESATSEQAEPVVEELAEPVTEPAPVPPEKQKAKGAAERKEELAKEIQQALKDRKEASAALETVKKELDELTKQRDAIKPQVKASAQDDPEPTWADFEKDGKSYEQFIDSRARWSARQEFKSVQAAEEKARIDAKNKELNTRLEENWKKRVAVSKELHSDFAEFAGVASKAIQSNSVLDGWVLDSELGTEILYYLGKDPSELERFVGLSVFQASRELTKLELKLSETPVTKKVSGAPPPPKEIGGKGTQPVNEIAAAVDKSDFAAFKRLETQRETAHLRKG